MNLTRARAVRLPGPARPRPCAGARVRSRRIPRTAAPLLRVELAVYVRDPGIFPFTVTGVTSMGAMMSWFLSVLAVLGLVIVAHHLGVDLTAAIGSTLRETAHWLSQPILPT